MSLRPFTPISKPLARPSSSVGSSARRRPSATLLALRLILLSLAVAASPIPARTAHAADPPLPLLPEDGAALPQDNLFSECTIYGLGWEFAWSDAGPDARYELYVERAGGPAPYFNQMLAQPAIRV